MGVVHERFELIAPFLGSLLVDKQLELVSALALDLEEDVTEEVDDGDDDHVENHVVTVAGNDEVYITRICLIPARVQVRPYEDRQRK